LLAGNVLRRVHRLVPTRRTARRQCRAAVVVRSIRCRKRLSARRSRRRDFACAPGHIATRPAGWISG
jgi:hypothetical protein